METYSASEMNQKDNISKDELLTLTEKLYDLTQLLREIISILPPEQTSVLSKKLQEKQQKRKIVL